MNFGAPFTFPFEDPRLAEEDCIGWSGRVDSNVVGTIVRRWLDDWKLPAG